jgi:hypothetical protein
VGLQRGPLSLASATEELLGRKSSGSGLEIQDYGRKGSSALTKRHPCVRKKLALTSPTSGGRSVSIVRSRTKVTEFFLFKNQILYNFRYCVQTNKNAVSEQIFYVDENKKNKSFKNTALYNRYIQPTVN